MLYQQLKERTLPHHQALEKKLVDRIRKIRSTDQYVELLRLMYGYYASLEAHLERFVGTMDNISFPERRKAVSILHDLSHFGAEAPRDICTDLPVIRTHAEAIGAMYVLEGSTLGGKIIAGMITRQLRVEHTRGFAFFLFYGDNTQKMWESFKQTLASPYDDAEAERMVQAASNTFITFKNWIDRHDTN